MSEAHLTLIITSVLRSRSPDTRIKRVMAPCFPAQHTPLWNKLSVTHCSWWLVPSRVGSWPRSAVVSSFRRCRGSSEKVKMGDARALINGIHLPLLRQQLHSFNGARSFLLALVPLLSTSCFMLDLITYQLLHRRARPIPTAIAPHHLIVKRASSSESRRSIVQNWS